MVLQRVKITHLDVQAIQATNRQERINQTDIEILSFFSLVSSILLLIDS